MQTHGPVVTVPLYDRHPPWPPASISSEAHKCSASFVYSFIQQKLLPLNIIQPKIKLVTTA